MDMDKLQQPVHFVKNAMESISGMGSSPFHSDTEKGRVSIRVSDYGGVA